MKIGILRETKTPPDRRVALTPDHIRELIARYPEHEFRVQSSKLRIFEDDEYRKESIEVSEKLDDCDLLLGVKEPDLPSILPDKTYLFFSHTAKEQAHNRILLQALAEKRCTLIDYEYLTQNNNRVVAFGYWAGIVGGYQTLRVHGSTSGNYNLKAPENCRDLAELKEELKKVSGEGIHIVITGEGRVAGGAAEMLLAAGIQRVSPEEFLKTQNEGNYFCHTGPQHYTKHFSGQAFDFKHFIHHPDEYHPNFVSFSHKANIFIACHFWDNRSPHFFTKLDLQNPDFKIRLVSDISCDVPGPIPTTIRSSRLDKPFYGIARKTCEEIEPFDPDQITVCAVDNLPSALPYNASIDFGKQLMNAVIPELLSEQSGEIIKGATILEKGKLTDKYAYMEEYLKGR